MNNILTGAYDLPIIIVHGSWVLRAWASARFYSYRQFSVILLLLFYYFLSVRSHSETVTQLLFRCNYVAKFLRNYRMFEYTVTKIEYSIVYNIMIYAYTIMYTTDTRTGGYVCSVTVFYVFIDPVEGY